jgi:CHAT domain-containing protein
LRLGRAATETEVKALDRAGELALHKIVYFATHGLVSGDIKGLGEPALALSLPQKATPEDDGLLTASEVTQLHLNADWVVLSACNTASGDKPGAEALSGLARAFFYSGARSLLVSHWPVYSDAATLLTTSAFKIIEDGQKAQKPVGRAEALRRSMLALIRKKDDDFASHPSYWAPFVVVGEGAVVTR